MGLCLYVFGNKINHFTGRGTGPALAAGKLLILILKNGGGCEQIVGTLKWIMFSPDKNKIRYFRGHFTIFSVVLKQASFPFCLLITAIFLYVLSCFSFSNNKIKNARPHNVTNK